MLWVWYAVGVATKKEGEFSWLKEEENPTRMGVETEWTLAPSCPSSGVGSTAPQVPRAPAAAGFLLQHLEGTTCVLMVQDVPWSLLQCSKKQGEGGRGRKQLLEPFCLYPCG